MLRILAAVMVVSWVFSTALPAQEEPVRREGLRVIASYREGVPVEYRPEGEPREGQEIKQRIRQLLNEAEEAEQRAAQLRAEAKELERAISGRLKDRDRGFHAEAMHEKLLRMRDQAERAQMDGRREEAREIQKGIDMLAGEIEKAQIHQTEMQIEKLERQAHEAEQRGEGEQARKLWARIEKIGRVLRRDRGDREGPERLEMMHREHGELREAAERAEREGRYDEAHRIGEKAEMLARELGERERQMERRRVEEVDRKVASLEREAREAERRGEGEQAGKLWARVEQVGQALHLDRRRDEVVDLIERMHPLVEDLKRSCAEALERGDHDRAAELQGTVEKIVDMIAGQLDRRGGIERDEPRGEFRRDFPERERPRVMLEGPRQVEVMMQLSPEAVEKRKNADTERDRPRVMEDSPRQVEVMMRLAPEAEEKQRNAETVREQIEEMIRAADEAELDGRSDRAVELRRGAEELERTLGDFWAVAESPDLKPQIGELNALADDADKAGDKEQAQMIRREIQELERPQVEVRIGRPQPDVRGERPQQEVRIERRVEINPDRSPIEREVDTLRQEVRSLREDMNWLKEALKQKLNP